MKLFFIIACYLLNFNSYAAKAVIISHEAPLLHQENLNSKVLQTRYRGDVVYINDRDIDTSPFSVEYNVDSDGNPINEAKDIEDLGFYKTLTRDGKDAYIPKRYVKVLYMDSRELMVGRKKFKHDPTDYRVEEPLPDDYPLYNTDHKKALILVGYGPSIKTGYPYRDKIIAEQYSSRYGANLIYTGAVNFDLSRRSFFGTMFQIFNQTTEFLMDDDRITRESHTELGVGPYISYDFYRTKKHCLTLGGGFSLNYHRYLIEQEGDVSGFEQRIFSGFSLSSKLSTMYIYKKFIPGTDLDLAFGLEAQFNLPHSLESSTAIEVDEFWNENSDAVAFDLSGQYALYFGIQSNY
jgi:hypothetical protein